MSYTNGLDKPTDYFNTKLYTGDGTDGRGITGVGFQPDWVWIKQRNGTFYHRVFDVIRGVEKELYPNDTGAEVTDNRTLQSFDTDGFTLGTFSGTNGSGNTFASWNWLAGGTASSNTDGSITSNVSANTTSGFSIVTWTGSGANATIGHGIDTPKMIIVKCRSTDYHWPVYHHKNGNGNVQYLNLTNASASGSGFWNSTTPTSSVFSVGTDNAVNQSGETYIAYCFQEKKGFSKFGSYTGNGNADGTFIYTGFKPAFVIIKGSSGITNWTMYDNKRDPFNTTTQNLRPNTSGAETTDHDIDMLSNGFKHRGSGSGGNGSGISYIYMAFAENPFVTSSGIPTCAR